MENDVDVLIEFVDVLDVVVVELVNSYGGEVMWIFWFVLVVVVIIFLELFVVLIFELSVVMVEEDGVFEIMV